MNNAGPWVSTIVVMAAASVPQDLGSASEGSFVDALRRQAAAMLAADPRSEAELEGAVQHRLEAGELRHLREIDRRDRVRPFPS